MGKSRPQQVFCYRVVDETGGTGSGEQKGKVWIPCQTTCFSGRRCPWVNKEYQLCLYCRTNQSVGEGSLGGGSMWDM